MGLGASGGWIALTELGLEDSAAGVERVVVVRLEGPLADEDREVDADLLSGGEELARLCEGTGQGLGLTYGRRLGLATDD